MRVAVHETQVLLILKTFFLEYVKISLNKVRFRPKVKVLYALTLIDSYLRLLS